MRSRTAKIRRFVVIVCPYCGNEFEAATPDFSVYWPVGKVKSRTVKKCDLCRNDVTMPDVKNSE